ARWRSGRWRPRRRPTSGRRSWGDEAGHRKRANRSDPAPDEAGATAERELARSRGREMAVPRVGLITIGQAPRDDVVPEMLAQLGFEVEAIQLGAIDGLSLEEVWELAPRGDEPWAVSRLRDGTEVRLAKRELDPRMQRCVDALEA